MEEGTEVWIKPKPGKKGHGKDTTVWMLATVEKKENIDEKTERVTIKDKKGEETIVTVPTGTIEMEELKPHNVPIDGADIENLIDLPYLNEPEILSYLSKRYGKNMIYTYTGAILIAINPFDVIKPDSSCDTLMHSFSRRIKNAAVSMAPGAGTRVTSAALAAADTGRLGNSASSDDVNAPSSSAGGEQQLLRNHSILISGESGSGKSICSNIVMKYLIDLKDRDGEDNDSDDDMDAIMGGIDRARADSGMSIDEADSPSTAATSRKSGGRRTGRKSLSYYRAFQLSTMDKIKQANPILQALGNARTSHTYNSSRVGKYFELSFTKNGDLLGGNITTYLLENVRVVNQLPGDRNFHIFYQLMAGASEMEKRLWALSNVDEYHYANQGKASQVPSIDDEKDYLELKQAFFGLDFDPEAVTQVLQLVAGLLHIGNINFRGVQEREGEVAHIIENIAGDGTGARAASRARRAMQRSASAKQKALAAANAEDAEAEIAAQAAALDLDGDEEGGGGDDDDEGEGEQETVLEAAARLCCFPLEELKDTLTMRSVELNREVFRKHLTPVQAANARDAVAKAIYKHLFDWIVNELNKKLMPTDDIATEVHSGVGILDIFGFDAFETNSFEQLLINYANESLQQQFNHHMFKLEIAEYTQEGISFEDITFPDNQESLDLISLGVFKTLDDQCRIPNPSDKRFAAAIYKDCKKFKKFSVSFAEESQDQFSISHFAGKVSYSTDKFIEKNLDELPQDAMVLLSHSTNAALGTAAAEAQQAAQHKAQAAAAKGSGAGGGTQRRGSAHRNATPSVVAQFRNELTKMIARINCTVPHYVRCINPLGREYLQNGIGGSGGAGNGSGGGAMQRQHSDVSGMGAGKLPFNYLAVAEQLRYGGVLEAVRVARSGFPFRLGHREFFERYRRLADPAHPLSASLPLYVTKEMTPDDHRTLCKTLIETLTVRSGGAAKVASVLHLKLQSELQYGSARRSSISAWIANLGGLITAGTVQAGYTKVFMHKAERALLESCRFHLIQLCNKKISSAMAYRLRQIRHKRQLTAVFVMQRIARGMIDRSKARRLRRQRDAMLLKQLMKDTHAMGSAVLKFKQDDHAIQTEISKLISAKKLSDEEALLRLDVAAVKKDMKDYSMKFREGTVFQVKTAETADALDYGYNLLLAHKLIPLTTFGKAFSVGRKVKPENRTASVKYANKSVTKDHPMFKGIVKVMDRLRELMELAKLEKDMLDGRRKKLFSSAGAAEKELAEMDVKMHYIGKVAGKTRTVYQYYHHYVLQMVKEFGNNSPYKSSFEDPNHYLLELVQLVEAKQPILAAERNAAGLGPANAPDGSSSKVAGANGDGSNGSTKQQPKSALSVFPLEVPADESDPKRRGAMPLCSYNSVRFKTAPFAPGVEFVVNSLREVLAGGLVMYPIHYIKIVGKAGSNQGRESYYQASQHFTADNMSPILSLPHTRAHYDHTHDYSKYLGHIKSSDFSALFLTFLLTGAAEAKPENIMIEFMSPHRDPDNNGCDSVKERKSVEEVALGGVNTDESFCSVLFAYERLNKAPALQASESGLNILYLFPQVDQPVSAEVTKYFSKSEGRAEELTSIWLRELYLQNKRYSALKSVGFDQNDFTNLFVPIRLPVGAAAGIYTRLKKVCSLLRHNAAAAGEGAPSVTHAALFSAVYPVLSAYYDKLRSNARDASVPLKTVYQKQHLHHISQKSLHDIARAVEEEVGGDATNARTLSTFTASLEDVSLEFLKVVDFSAFRGLEDEDDLLPTLYENLSFLPVLWLHKINEQQLAMMFDRLLRVAEANMALQAKITIKKKQTHLPMSLITKHIVLTGLTDETAEKLSVSHVVRQIRRDLGIRVSVGAAAEKAAAAEKQV